MKLTFECFNCKESNIQDLAIDLGNPMLLLETNSIDNKIIELDCEYCGSENKINLSDSELQSEPVEMIKNESDFYIEWGRESLKNNVTYLNELFAKFITINAALAGGAVIQNSIKLPSLKIAIILFFIGALVVAFLGYLPYEATVDLNDPEKIKVHKIKATKDKRNYLWITAVLMVLGLSLAMIGVFIGEV